MRRIFTGKGAWAKADRFLQDEGFCPSVRRGNDHDCTWWENTEGVTATITTPCQSCIDRHYKGHEDIETTGDIPWVDINDRY